jgi:hypothetical protein
MCDAARAKSGCGMMGFRAGSAAAGDAGRRPVFYQHCTQDCLRAVTP